MTPVSLENCESPLKGKDCCLRCQAVMFACVYMLLTECVWWIALQTSCHMTWLRLDRVAAVKCVQWIALQTSCHIAQLGAPVMKFAVVECV